MRTADGYIVHKCLNGDAAAFGLLVERYKEGVYALAYSKLGNFHDAEDVTQEVFIKVYKNLHRLRQWESIHAWIYSITSNLCKNWVRAASRRPDRDFIEDYSRVSSDPLPGHSHTGSPMLDFVHEALASLPETYRQVINLYYITSMNTREIAEFLGISPSNVRQRLSRARTQLKEETIAMMNTAYEEHRIPAGFTFRIVEAVKRMKIHPTPRSAGLPWGLSLAAGIMIAVLSIGSHLNLPELFPSPASPAQAYESRMAEFGEMPVDMLRISRMPISFGRQGNEYGGGFQLPNQQNAVLMAPIVIQKKKCKFEINSSRLALYHTERSDTCECETSQAIA